MEGWLDPAEVFNNFFLESSLPRRQAWSFPIKDKGIPLIPNTPGSNHNNFHEVRMHEILSGNMELLMYVSILIPSNSQSKPSGNR